MRTILMLSALAALGACTTTAGGASSSAPTSGYSAELNTLEQQCTTRGGMLRPLGRTTGQASLDYACIIHDGTSQRLQ